MSEGMKSFGFRGIRGDFFAALSLAEAGSWAMKIGKLFTSDQEIETYKWLGAVQQMREWVGGRHERRLRDETYTITNKKYEDTLPFLNDDIRRDKTGQMVVRIEDMATRAATHWEKLITDLLIANGDSYDGESFFGTAHISGSSGTQINELGVSQVPSSLIASADVGAPTSEELANIILEMCSYMFGYKDDVGEPINQNAKEFTVMVPVNMYGHLQGALSSQFIGSGITNPLSSSDFVIKSVVNPRLVEVDELMVFRTDGGMRSIILQSEVGITDEIKDDTFDSDRKIYGIKAVRNVGYGLWSGATRVTLTT